MAAPVTRLFIPPVAIARVVVTGGIHVSEDEADMKIGLGDIRIRFSGAPGKHCHVSPIPWMKKGGCTCWPIEHVIGQTPLVRITGSA